MIKLFWLAAIVVLAWRLFAGRWPWESGKIAARNRAETQARTLLGVRSGAPREEIIEAHRRLPALFLLKRVSGPPPRCEDRRRGSSALTVSYLLSPFLISPALVVRAIEACRARL